MQTFLIALGAVAVLLLAAAPGYLLMKRRVLSEACIPGFSKLLLFVCQPCLCIYTFRTAVCSPEKLGQLGIFALLVVGLHALMLSGVYLLLRKKSAEQAVYRIMTVASVFGNCAFFGIPLIEALFPETSADLLIYTTVYAVVMNILGWTVGSAIIAHDPRHIRVKKVLLNPATIGLILALPLFFTGWQLPVALGNMIDIFGKMCSPLSMLIMGMRLATMPLRRVFCERRVYLAVFLKQIIMPLITFGVLWALPVSRQVCEVLFVIACCPVASIVLNFSEILGEGQGEAASAVLLGTTLSILTIPLMVLLLPLLV